MKQKLMTALRLISMLTLLIFDATVLLPYQVFWCAQLLYRRIKDRRGFEKMMNDVKEGARYVARYIETGEFFPDEEEP